MGRVINPDSAGKDRTRLCRAIVVTLREVAVRADISGDSRDMAAFIALGLEQIAAGIDTSVAAWEKRGYWVKADRFRMEWAWAGSLGPHLREALLADDWGSTASIMAEIAQRLSKVKVPAGHRMGKPWGGSYEALVRTE
jgi:hypothetical protein